MSSRPNKHCKDLSLPQLFYADLPAACKRYRDFALHLQQRFEKPKFDHIVITKTAVRDIEFVKESMDDKQLTWSLKAALSLLEILSGLITKSGWGPLERIDPEEEFIAVLKAADQQMVSIIDEIWFKNADMLRCRGKKQELVHFRNKFRHKIHTFESLIWRRGFYMNSEEFLEEMWKRL